MKGHNLPAGRQLVMAAAGGVILTGWRRGMAGGGEVMSRRRSWGMAPAQQQHVYRHFYPHI